MKATLSLDLGTSSTRARLYAADTGQAIGDLFAHRLHTPTRTDDGGEVLDPNALLEEITACLREVLGKAPPSMEILGVGMSCFWHSIIGLDRDNSPQTPVLLWSDRRSAKQVADLKKRFPDTPAITGCPWHTSYVAGRLLWLSETDPKTFAHCTRFVSPAEYIYGKLFGFDKVTVSRSMASATGLLKQESGDWYLEGLPLRSDQLSPLGDAPVSSLLPTYAELLPLLADIPWFPALGDGACSNIGCGAVAPSTMALMIGTSGAMRLVTPGLPLLPEGLWRYQIDGDRSIIGGALSNGGNVWAWLEKTLALSHEPVETEEAFAQLLPDGHHLTVLPFLSGERAPLWQDGLTATIHGLTTTTPPIEIAQAFREAVAYRFAGIWEQIKTITPSTQQTRIIGTGAALRLSPTWTQTIVNVIGEPVYFVDEEEASARGAALWAREQLGLGKIEDVPVPQIVAVYKPDASAHKIYQKARERHEHLRKKMADMVE